MELVNDILSMSPPMLLMLGLTMMGTILKRTPQICNWCIPYILVAVGTVSYIFIADPADASYKVRNVIVFQAWQGFCMSAATVGAHSAYRHFIRRERGPSGETKFIRNSRKPKTQTP